MICSSKTENRLHFKTDKITSIQFMEYRDFEKAFSGTEREACYYKQDAPIR